MLRKRCVEKVVLRVVLRLQLVQLYPVCQMASLLAYLVFSLMMKGDASCLACLNDLLSVLACNLS
jgi:hypothetical protein